MPLIEKIADDVRKANIIKTSKLPWIFVNSSNIRAVAWVPDVTEQGDQKNAFCTEGFLFIRFHSGYYRYDKVPAVVYGHMIGAQSPGKAFHVHVRGQFDCVRYNEQMDVLVAKPKEEQVA